MYLRKHIHPEAGTFSSYKFTTLYVWHVYEKYGKQLRGDKVTTMKKRCIMQCISSGLPCNDSFH